MHPNETGRAICKHAKDLQVEIINSNYKVTLRRIYTFEVEKNFFFDFNFKKAEKMSTSFQAAFCFSVLESSADSVMVVLFLFLDLSWSILRDKNGLQRASNHNNENSWTETICHQEAIHLTVFRNPSLFDVSLVPRLMLFSLNLQNYLNSSVSLSSIPYTYSHSRSPHTSTALQLVSRHGCCPQYLDQACFFFFVTSELVYSAAAKNGTCL